MLPRSVARGAHEAGIGQRRGCFDRAMVLLGRRHSVTGSHLPLEDTAPPFAGAPFASSPFAHPSRKAAIAPAEIYSALPRGFLTR